MLRIIIVLYLLCICIYGIGAYLVHPKVDKPELLGKLGIALLIGTLASAILTTIVFLF